MNMIFYFINLLRLLGSILLYGFCYCFDMNTDYSLNCILNNILNNGCLAIKFTQWIISRIENLYDCKEINQNLLKFNILLENCPAHSIEYTKQSFFKSFKCDISSIFYDIKLKDIRSGCIGQVYEAKRRIDDKQVVIKVKHPKVDTDVYNQKWILIYLLKLLDWLDIYNKLPPINYNDFFITIDTQLNFLNEYKNLCTFYKNFKDNNYIIIPEPYFASKDILVMSYEPGIRYDNNKTSNREKYLISNLLMLTLRQCFLIDNFAHADLHRGNWKIRKEDKDIKLVIYDFGICFKGFNLESNRKFVRAWETKDSDKIAIETMKMLYCEDKKLLKDFKEYFKQKFLPTLTVELVLNITFNYIKKRKLIINGIYLNLMISLGLLEKIFIETGTYSDENQMKNYVDMFSKQYVDNIAFCEAKNIFPELCSYLKYIVKKDLNDTIASNINNKESEIIEINI